MNRTNPYRDAWIARARECDLLKMAERHGAVLKRNGREHTGPCPSCGGKDRFSIHPIKSKWHCRGHGGGGDAIGMVQHFAGLSFLEAVEDITGEPPPNGEAKPLSESERAERNRRRLESEARQREREAAQQAQEEDSREYAATIIGESKSLIATPAEIYFNRRGIADAALLNLHCLAYHDKLSYPGSRGTHGAVVCRVDDVIGNVTAAWRIYVTPDGKKLDVENPKLGIGPAGGGAVRIGGFATKIGIAEGVESALAAYSLIGRRHPVWAALSTSGLIGFEAPLGVQHVIIFPDGDRPIKKQDGEYVPTIPPGRKAAQALRDRLLSEGVAVTIAAEPGIGRDYADLWLEHMRELV